VATPDYYITLDVGRDATDDDLKRAYRKLVISLHPDRHGGTEEATERFQRVVEAYSVLSDPDKRTKYDEGHIVRGMRFEKGGNAREFIGGFFDNVLGVRPRQPARGYDHLYRLELSLVEVAQGVTKELSIPSDEVCHTCCGRGFESGVMPNLCERCDGLGVLRRRKLVRSEIEDCPDCAGRGYLIEDPCKDCHGKGMTVVIRQVKIDIPAGVEHGAKLLIRGAGQSGWQGGEKGDCWVHVSVKEHPYLERDGWNLICRRPISIFQALAGTKLQVPTVDGVVNIKVPPRSADASPLKMPSYGILDASTDQRGDQLVILDVEMPQGLTAADMTKINELLGQLSDEAFPKTQNYDRLLRKGSADD
tara:strand:+ start:4103 stop:5188 length:1086 start_codon:yes stop_codon:yes gene_type:complete